jgi:uncharacterized C2H2 Zn-finger protein
MAHKFALNFKNGWITRTGPKLIPVGLKFNAKFHPGRQKCYEYVVKDREGASQENVSVSPIQNRKDKWLYGPATLLTSRRIVYPCSRFRCGITCPCLICAKQHPRCRAGPSCDCEECHRQFNDHESFHACFHFGCKSCNNIVKTIPYFNFFFLDKHKKPTNKGVYLEEQLEPRYQLPPSLRPDMVSTLLKVRNWSKKLKNFKCGVDDDGIWCVGCSTMFFSVDELQAHILANHNTSKIFRHHCENADEKLVSSHKCDSCEKTFGSRTQLYRHADSVHNMERIECSSCDLTFSQMDNYETHWVNKHQKTPRLCKNCGLKFKTCKSYLKHILREDCSASKCESCEKTFSRKKDLERHRQEVCSEKVFVVKCDDCGTTFIRSSDKVRHIKNRQQPDGSARFNCEVCDKTACNMKLLKAHIKIEHGNKKLCVVEPKVLGVVDAKKVRVEQCNIHAYECELCEKKFGKEDTLLKHKATHKISNKVKCEVCGSEFSLKKNYTRHMNEALGKDGNPQNKCHICSKTFCTGKILSGHISCMHKEEFLCTLCQKTFNHKHHYERHIKDRDLVSCEDCGNSFCNKKGYTKHIDSIHSKCSLGDKADGVAKQTLEKVG